jgi:hypothetical protein
MSKLEEVIRAIISFFGLKFNITQHRFGRKLYGGEWYYILVTGLVMAPFWSDTEITSCQAKTLKKESHGKVK